jgi:di/tricarboxylate transporter
MTSDQILILGILAATVVAFLWGRWRHDMVALGSLLACVFTGLVPSSEAFAGFGHPAVITVGAVLVLSRGLQTSGAVNVLTQRLIPGSAGPTFTIGALTALGALLSAFMNNVGALALLMPVAIQIANKQSLPHGRVLMPLAFGSILGGMTTLIGTPSNLIVSGFRAGTGAGGFAMFDFTPVGLAVAGGGVIFVALVGWRLVPARERAGVEGFDTGAYLTEARITENSKMKGKTLREIGAEFEEADAQVVGMVRNNFRLTVPNPSHVLHAGDILVIEAEPDALSSMLSNLGLTLVEDVPVAPEKKEAEPAAEAPSPPQAAAEEPAPATTDSATGSEEIGLMELAVRPESFLIGRSATDLQLRTRFRINLLAISRQGRRSIRRLRSEHVQAGDVLLMQGRPGAIMTFSNEFGCVPWRSARSRFPTSVRR